MKPANRTFIISGACSGLGLATARALHAAGASIALLDLNHVAGEAIVSELGKDTARFWEVDVSETESITAAIAGAAAWVKETGRAIGGVVAAAGVGSAAKLVDGRTGEPVGIEALDFVLNINLRGTLDLLRQALPHMIKTTPTADGERGVLILVSSSAAFDGQPGQVAYAASKGAIASLTLPLARDLARYGIRAVTIAPSLFESAMTARLPEKARKSLERVMEFPVRPGKPEEFASLAMQAVENQMLNGTVIRIDGAMRMPSKM
ncbi:short chain dehydrogenase reductase [Trichodelitschia bisporula]|uniref:Short chain dehydrogenase reductase n=1 Tax=Trichodelitschia bisporula TaxID=703511 RepID=A0A6G1I076_9PEZI|nr:short chain dehydrogenase reductase [Trichodelitschia bisporula]